MAEQEKLHRRPLGELLVQIDQPVARFGQQITLAVRGEENTLWVAQVGEGGNMFWLPTDRGVYPQPTLYMDDVELAALERALAQVPVRYKGDSAVEHLGDVIHVRDVLLKMHDDALQRHHEQVMAYLRQG